MFQTDETDGKIVMNGKYIRLWKAVVSHLNVLSQQTSGETD